MQATGLSLGAATTIASIMLWTFVVLTGLSFGAVAPLQGLYAADLFGPQRIGTLMGMQQMALAVATAAGPFVAGVSVDLTNSYKPMLLAAVGLNIGALPIFRTAAQPTRRQRQLRIRQLEFANPPTRYRDANAPQWRSHPRPRGT